MKNLIRKFYWLIGPNGLVVIFFTYAITSSFEYFKFRKIKSKIDHDVNNNDHLKQLNQNYYFKDKTNVFGIDHKDLVNFFKKILDNNKNIERANNKIFWIEHLISKKEKNEAARFFLNKKILNLAYNYLKTVPILHKIHFYETVESEEFSKSQFWHLDTTHKKIFKIFWSPFGVSEDSGPTTICLSGKKSKIWQFLNYPNFPSYFNDKEFKESKLNSFQTKKILMNSDELSICDTCNLFHYGSRFEKKRFIVILEFAGFNKFDLLFKEDKDLKDINRDICNLLTHRGVEQPGSSSGS